MATTSERVQSTHDSQSTPDSHAPSGSDAIERLIRLPVRAVVGLGDVIQLGIGLFLLVIAAVVLVRTCSDLVSSGSAFPTRITDAINGVLFVVIILELLETVMSHFKGGGFQLQPFLVIGIISAVRHVLTVGARLSLEGEGTFDSFRRAQIELGVDAAVVLALTVALILVRRSSTSDTD